MIHQQYDSPFLVHGNGAVLHLCELWGVDNDQDSKSEWVPYQEGDAEGRRWRRESVESGREYQVGQDTVVVQGSSRILYRRREFREKAIMGFCETLSFKLTITHLNMPSATTLGTWWTRRRGTRAWRR